MHRLALLFCLLISLTSFCSATVVTFDDLSDGMIKLPTNYAGLTWSNNWWYLNAPQAPNYNPSSSPKSAYASPDQGTFAFASPVIFDGAYFAGYETQQFELYLGGLLVHTSNVLSLSGTPTFLASGYAGQVDEVRLTANTTFVIDDITYSDAIGGSVPEPSTFAFLGLGLSALAILRRRRS